MGKQWNVFYRSRRWTGERPSRWMPMGRCGYVVLTRDRKYLMSALPFRGSFACGVWDRGATVGTWRADALEWRERPSMKPVKIAERGSVRHLAALETEYLADVQSVADAVAMLQYEDGTPRQGGYLGIWCNGSAWCVRITDKTADATLTAEGRTVDEALDTLAMLLGSENAPWEPNSRKKPKKGS